jgi:hypothetical protein
MVTITFADAVTKLENHEIDFMFDDTAITVTARYPGVKPNRKIPFVDSIGSLVDRDLINLEVEFAVAKRIK